jgi:hypothetical protein
MARFPLHPTEQAVVANPWGDGRCYERFSEAFLLDELRGAAAVGATHYQIDDGWQAGGILADLTLNNKARPRSYWDIDAEKFPQGFKPLMERVRECGVQLALWFGPDMPRQYRNWEEERDLLLEMYRQYNIRLVKIDGVRLFTKPESGVKRRGRKWKGVVLGRPNAQNTGLARPEIQHTYGTS